MDLEMEWIKFKTSIEILFLKIELYLIEFQIFTHNFTEDLNKNQKNLSSKDLRF